jgi:hypothetical protein
MDRSCRFCGGRPWDSIHAAFRRRAVCRACRDRDFRDAASGPSRFSARSVARDRFGAVFRPGFFWPFRYARSALRRVLSETLPFLGGGSFTPARRAFESPIAIACFVERAPCFPSRICSISSRTNSPAWVVGRVPLRAFSLARRMVSRSGISTPLALDGFFVSCRRRVANPIPVLTSRPLVSLL